MAGLIHGGFVLCLLGCASLVHPLLWLGIASRGCAVLILSSGLLAMIVGLALPAAEKQSASCDTRLDQFVPVYQFQEFHSLRINANADQLYHTIKAVTADEILFFQTLTWIRRRGRVLPEGILNVPKGQSILDVASPTAFLVLAEEPRREIVFGTWAVSPPGSHRAKVTVQDFTARRASGIALAAINFRVTHAERGASSVSTETRVYATDASARRKFARYWRVIYPGSAH